MGGRRETPDALLAQWNHGSTFSASVCDFRGPLSVVINAVKVVDLTTLREI
jgi:hypothetical protein